MRGMSSIMTAPVPSGMAAVQLSLMGLLRAGDHLVAGRALFGSCRWIISEWLPRFGVETTYVDATDLFQRVLRGERIGNFRLNVRLAAQRVCAIPFGHTNPKGG